MIGISACSYGEGWTIMAACAPSKAPRWSSRTLPPPPSSAGVPSTVTRRPASSATRARATPAPAAMAAITLWPQAWPTAGRASYSAQTTTCSGPDPARAANAVGRSPTPRSTSSPAPSSSSHSQAQACSSSNPSSGLAWMRWLRATSSSLACSTRSRAASLASATSVLLRWGLASSYGRGTRMAPLQHRLRRDRGSRCHNTYSAGIARKVFLARPRHGPRHPGHRRRRRVRGGHPGRGGRPPRAPPRRGADPGRALGAGAGRGRPGRPGRGGCGHRPGAVHRPAGRGLHGQGPGPGLGAADGRRGQPRPDRLRPPPRAAGHLPGDRRPPGRGVLRPVPPRPRRGGPAHRLPGAAARPAGRRDRGQGRGGAAVRGRGPAVPGGVRAPGRAVRARRPDPGLAVGGRPGRAGPAQDAARGVHQPVGGDPPLPAPARHRPQRGAPPGRRGFGERGLLMATIYPPRRQVDDPRNPMAIELTPMRRRHIPQVLDIERRVYPRPWTMTLFLSEIVQRSTRYYIVARARRKVVGYAGLMVFGDEAHVTNIAVDPGLHRRKVASRLLFALVTEARRRGASACTLEVRVANHPAQALYHQFGFAPVGIRKNYYAETGEDALIMWAEGLQTPAYAERLAGLAARIPEPREL